MENYIYVERKDYNRVITIKLVIPSKCQAKCKFCYINDYKDKMVNDKGVFLNNFLSSLDSIIKSIGNKNEISLDITGNEPTYYIELLQEILLMLRGYDIKRKVLRVTITTNGMNLDKLIPYFDGVIDYVNISIHHYDYNKRNSIFGCITKTDDEYSDIIDKLNNIGITTSAISVIYEPIPNFKVFMNDFINWCKNIGFISLRFRNDVFWSDSQFEEYIDMALNDNQFYIIDHENTTDSHWCRLRRYDKFRVFFLKGVKDTSMNTKGIEYIIADDGKCYVDFYKTTRIEDYQYEIGKIYDRLL